MLAASRVEKIENLFSGLEWNMGQLAGQFDGFECKRRANLLEWCHLRALSRWTTACVGNTVSTEPRGNVPLNIKNKLLKKSAKNLKSVYFRFP